jgi:hypothetical protein
MAFSVSLSTRVSPELRERLTEEARSRHMNLAAYARDVLEGGVNGDSRPEPERGGLANEIECVFAHLPDETGVRREVALQLARVVEAGGSPSVTASRELVELIDHTLLRYGPEWDEDDNGEEQPGEGP